MLDQLDSVPWSKLSHAYGAAIDVPPRIRALGSADSEARRDAIHKLHGNIWHQGTVYEATAYAVPFLLELAGSPQTPERDNVLALLGAIAEGSSYIAVHKDVVNFNDPESIERERTELEWVAKARRAVRSGWTILLECLQETNHLISTSAAYVLSRYSEDGIEVAMLIRARFDKAADDDLLRTGLLMLIKDLAPKVEEIAPWAQSVFARESEVSVRVPAAIAVAHATGQKVPDEIVAFLTEVPTSDDKLDEAYVVQPWDRAEPMQEIFGALWLSSRGRRSAVIRFNELLGAGCDRTRLDYCDYVLRSALSMYEHGIITKQPLEPLPVPPME